MTQITEQELADARQVWGMPIAISKAFEEEILDAATRLQMAPWMQPTDTILGRFCLSQR